MPSTKKELAINRHRSAYGPKLKDRYGRDTKEDWEKKKAYFRRPAYEGCGTPIRKKQKPETE